MKGLVTSKSGYAKLCCSNKLKFQWWLHSTMYTGFMLPVYKAQQGVLLVCLLLGIHGSKSSMIRVARRKQAELHMVLNACAQKWHTQPVFAIHQPEQDSSSSLTSGGRGVKSHLEVTRIMLVKGPNHYPGPAEHGKILFICVLQLPQLPPPLVPQSSSHAILLLSSRWAPLQL